MTAATLATSGRRPSVGRRTAASVTGLTLLGSAVVVTGAVLPWLSLYGGLDHLRGIDGTNGRVLIGAGVLSALVACVYAMRPSERLRWVIGALGFAASGFAAWDLSQLLGTYSQLQADPFAVAGLGPGAFLAVAGSLVVLATLLLPHDPAARKVASTQSPNDARDVLRNGMIAFLVGAAMIHLAVIGPHLQESTLYAAFFIGAAIAQVALAVLLTVRRDRLVLTGVVALSAAFIAVWVMSRTTGLPIGPQPGVAESVSLSDVVATVQEGLTIVLAVVALIMGRAVSVRRSTLRFGTATLVLVGVSATMVAVLAAQAS
jgi:hypothetical protein